MRKIYEQNRILNTLEKYIGSDFFGMLFAIAFFMLFFFILIFMPTQAHSQAPIQEYDRSCPARLQIITDSTQTCQGRTQDRAILEWDEGVCTYYNQGKLTTYDQRCTIDRLPNGQYYIVSEDGACFLVRDGQWFAVANGPDDLARKHYSLNPTLSIR